MVCINIYDDTPIDTSSSIVREKVSEAIKKYILENWDKCVNTETQLFTEDGAEKESTSFKIHL